MAKESRAVYVDIDVHKAIKVFSELEDQDIKDFLRDRTMGYLNERYGEDFISKVLTQTDPREALALISAKQMELGVFAERTILGSLVDFPRGETFWRGVSS